MNLRDKKELGVVLFTGAFSILEFLSFATFVGLASGSWFWTGVIAVLTITWLALVTFTLALSERAWGLWLLIAGIVAGVLLAGRLSSAAIGSAVLLVIFTLLARRSFEREIMNRITYKASDVFPPGLRLLMLGCILALVALSLPVIQGSIQSDRIKVTQQQIDPLLKPFEKVISQFLPGYYNGITVDELIQAQIREQTKQLPVGFSLSPNQLTDSRQQLSQKLDYQLNGTETIGTIVANVINGGLNNATRSSPVIVSLVLLAVVFLTLRAVIPFVIWPVVGCVMVLLWIGRKIELVYLTRNPAVIERLQL